MRFSAGVETGWPDWARGTEWLGLDCQEGGLDDEWENLGRNDQLDDRWVMDNGC